MQIDLHYGMTYVLSRIAGFSKNDAYKIAYSAQYVDDATNSGTIRFDNKAMYNRISSAHLPFDIKNNSNDIENHRVWIPFHFLPGNQGKDAGKQQDIHFLDKIICKPNSHVAQDMVNACLASKLDSYFLQRLGVTMHVYIDTWSHREFAGVKHDVNEVKDLDRAGFSIEEIKEKIASKFASSFFPLGHGGALSYPDYPFLKWSYYNGKGEKIERDNPTEFSDAAQWIYSALKCANNGDQEIVFQDMPSSDLEHIKELFTTLDVDDGEERLEGWEKSISGGKFSFGSEDMPKYVPKGVGSWKHAAINNDKKVDDGSEVYKYDPDFLNSDWKHFHDAIQDHRFTIINKILPKYGICVA